MPRYMLTAQQLGSFAHLSFNGRMHHYVFKTCSDLQ